MASFGRPPRAGKSMHEHERMEPEIAQPARDFDAFVPDDELRISATREHEHGAAVRYARCIAIDAWVEYVGDVAIDDRRVGIAEDERGLVAMRGSIRPEREAEGFVECLVH